MGRWYYEVAVEQPCLSNPRWEVRGICRTPNDNTRELLSHRNFRLVVADVVDTCVREAMLPTAAGDSPALPRWSPPSPALPLKQGLCYHR